jgi:hypothetical protein
MRTVLVSVLVFAGFLVVLELLFRLIVFVDKGAVEDRHLVLPHDTLGWVLNPRMRTKHIKNRCGEPVDLAPPPHPVILRRPAASDSENVVILGDSFTHAHEVSTGKAYHDIFARIEGERYDVYAVAVGGYGSLQEFLAFQQTYEAIRPDLLIWQLSGNDVSNNVFELDDSAVTNNQRPRPYLDPNTGQMTVRNPGLWLFDWSEGFAFVFKKLLIVDSKYDLGIMRWLNSLGEPDEDLEKKLEAQGLSVLDTLVKRIATSYPETTVVGFSVDPRFDRQYEAIFKASGALYIPEFYRSLARLPGTDCRPLDTHWNHLGNEAAGRALSERLNDVLDRPPGVAAR